jgi:plasmid stability protein
MGQLLIRQLDDATIERLKIIARERRTSVEALARDALTRAAQLTVDEKRALVESMQDWSRRVRNPCVPQSSAVDLIREGRDLDHRRQRRVQMADCGGR